MPYTLEDFAKQPWLIRCITTDELRHALKLGLNANTEKDGESLLYFAIEIQNMDKVRLLLDAGAAIDSPILVECAIQHSRQTDNSYDILRALLDAKAPHTGGKRGALQGAVALSDAKAVRMLRFEGADPNHPNRNYDTALHYVDDAEICAYLLKEGADANAVNLNGETPLHRTTDADVMQKLLEAGADVNAVDEQGETPLFKVLSVEEARILVRAGADRSIENIYGRTAYAEMMHWEDGESIYELLEFLNPERVAMTIELGDAVRLTVTPAIWEQIGDRDFKDESLITDISVNQLREIADNA